MSEIDHFCEATWRLYPVVQEAHDEYAWCKNDCGGHGGRRNWVT